MCLVSTTNKSSISNYNIICYKIVIPIDGKLITPYRDFSFTLNKVYTDKEKESITPMWDKYMIEGGFFHSYKSQNRALQEIDRMTITCHRNKVKPRDYKIFKAEIPSGTQFFEGDSEDLCSKSLRIIEECFD